MKMREFSWVTDEGLGYRNAYRPVIRGTRGAVAAGHYAAAIGGFQILDRGGNAFDAGVAAGICLNVVKPQSTSFGGIAPIIGYTSRNRSVFTISGVGRWPRGTDVKELRAKYPDGLRWGEAATDIIPAAPAAWLTCLADYGRMSFEDVVAPAIRLAEEGFPAYELYRAVLSDFRQFLMAFPNSKAVLCPGGDIPEVGTLIRQPALARLLRTLVEEERRLSHLGREAAIKGTLQFFYKGPVAEKIAEWSRQRGGYLTKQDLAEYRVQYEPPVRIDFFGGYAYTCGPWCQGPVLAQTLAILRTVGIDKYPHNSPMYLHFLLEALKLAFADREKYFGDPEFVNVPMDSLISEDYAKRRSRLIDPIRAWTEMPPPDDLNSEILHPYSVEMYTRPIEDAPDTKDTDTSCVCAGDSEGNVFSATPSDNNVLSDIVPDLGIAISQRGISSRVEVEHPNSVAPWKRPRITPSPALMLWPDGKALGFGTNGGDRQPQAMLQFLLNYVIYGMNLQQAVEAPRILTLSFPSSFPPYSYRPGHVVADARLGEATIAELRERGHKIDVAPAFPADTAVCAVLVSPEGRLEAAADPRRDAYAVGY